MRTFSAISWQQQVKFRYDIRFLLDQHSQLDFYSASLLKPWSTDRHVVPHRNIILIPFVLPLSAACLAEKQQKPFIFVFGLTGPGTELTIYHTRLEHAYHYTDTVCVQYVYKIKWNRLIK